MASTIIMAKTTTRTEDKDICCGYCGQLAPFCPLVWESESPQCTVLWPVEGCTDPSWKIGTPEW